MSLIGLWVVVVANLQGQETTFDGQEIGRGFEGGMGADELVN